MDADAHIHHINVNVDDLETAVPFYRDVLGLALDPTPEQGMASQFFRINDRQQIHMNVLADARAYRGHFCLEVPDFEGVFARAKAAGAIDTEPWGLVRALPNGKMQMFVRDPHGNLIEIASRPGAEIDPALFEDELVESERGIYILPPGAEVGATRRAPSSPAPVPARAAPWLIRGAAHPGARDGGRTAGSRARPDSCTCRPPRARRAERGAPVAGHRAGPMLVSDAASLSSPSRRLGRHDGGRDQRTVRP